MHDLEGTNGSQPLHRGVAEAAAGWYTTHARDLPWRAPGVSPWAVLVSEVMLQQTQVSRVEPVWRIWRARWPTPTALAVQPVAEAIRAWGRLGYPRRALRLHGCASAMVTRHDGQVPSDLASLLALPGIGTYTARAVATFAFRQRHPVVDTNVRRLVTRAVAGDARAGPATTMADLAAVEALLPTEPEAAAVASIAFMELGALVCTARAPRCDECPLRTTCAWRRAGSPAQPSDAAQSSDTSRRPGSAQRTQASSDTSRAPRRRTQRYIGSDRQVRGLLLAALRTASAPVPIWRLDMIWHDPEQRARALAGLVTDGLAHQVGTDHYALPQ